MGAGNDSGDRSVAIVGVACRLPGGVDGPDGLWRALVEGRDLVTAPPADRFDPDRFTDPDRPRPGRGRTAAGGYLADLAGFDAAHFGISPKEAAQVDPQHRLLLELAAEALDDAGIARDRLAGSDAAVFVGISDASYGVLQMMDVRAINAYTMTGAASSIAANRVSHFLDLRGPSMAVDTACSSSLVALDQACRALLDGTSRTALCGGVNALISPHHYVGFAQASMLSPRGRCAAFSADADGFARAEGGVVVVLKRLADALADGDRVHAVVLASGTNSDGRTAGLSLPDAEAQERLLREVHRRAGVHPDDLAYFEAHGTGTPVGDPVECAAIGRALGRGRTTGPLPIGSVKTNLGHLEPASGLAGVLKALLVLRHRRIPASLHADPPNPGIDFAGLGLVVAAEPRSIPAGGRVVVGVNSFGFGGANAHVVLASPPPPPAPAGPPGDAPRPVLVSGSTPAALAAATAALVERLADAPDFHDLAHTTCRRRTRHRHRVAVLADDAADAARLLAEAAPVEAVGAGRIGFVFCGNASQWAGMGADLFRDKDFRVAVEQVDTALAPHLGWSVARRLAEVTEQELSATEVAQPLLFAVQVGLTELLRAHGVRPEVVLGHSVGEVAAAWAAGALDLDQAAWVVAERSRAQAATAGAGRMAAVALSAADLRRWHPEVEIAGIGTADDVTAAGPAEEVGRLLADLAARGVACADLGLDHPFHTAAMDPLREPLRAALAGLVPAATAIPLVSTVTGARVDGTELGPEYWWRNVREPVRFADAVTEVLAGGADVLVEVGPHPVLRGYLRKLAATRPRTPTAVVPTLRRHADGPAAVRTAVAAVLAAGGRVDWDRYFPTPGRVVDLPAYPWQRERHWSGDPRLWVRTSGDARVHHPLLGERVPAPHPLWHNEVEPVRVPWLADHLLSGEVVVPAAGFAEMALAAGASALGRPVEVRRLEISRPLVVPWPDTAGVRTQVSVDPGDGAVAITSTQGADAEPRPHVRGRVRAAVGRPPAPRDPAALRRGLTRRLGGAELYDRLDDHGLAYGPAFRVLTGLSTGDGRVLAGYRHDAPAGGFVVHPVLLDGALQAGAPLISGKLAGEVFLPAAFDAVRVWRTPAPEGLVAVRERARTTTEVCWDIEVLDPDGAVAVELEGVRVRRMVRPDGTAVGRLRTALRAAPRAGEPAGPGPLPGAEVLLAAAGPRLADLRAAYEADLAGAAELGEQIAAHRLAGALGELAGPEFGLDDLVPAGVAARHTRLVELLLPVCLARGALVGTGRGRLRVRGDGRDVDRAVRRLLAEHPAAGAEAVLDLALNHDLAALLTGARDPARHAATEENERLLDRHFDLAPSCRSRNLVVQELVRQAARRWPADRPLRVLEVGAGGGGLTAAVLPVLPADRTRYTFTDVSAPRLARAAQRFAHHAGVEFRALDLDRDPAGQGFPEGGVDLVLAADALHAAPDLGRALAGVAALLAPGGRLLATEPHNPVRLAPLFGLQAEFWQPRDRDLRPRTALLPADEWPPLLRRAGFTDVRQLGWGGGDYSVLVATAPDAARALPALPPGDPGRPWLLLVEADDGVELAEGTARLLRAAGCPPPRVLPAARWAPDGTDPQVVLVLGGPVDDPVERTTRCAALLRAVAGRPGTGSVWLVTRPCGALPTEVEEPADAAVWGVARVLGNEHPDRAVRRISLSRAGDPARRLAAELLAPDAEDEVALTPGGRFAPREVDLPAEPTEPGSFRLEVRGHGLSYELGWRAVARPRPGPGQVRVAVRAAALNYRDVMQATGLLPARSYGSTGEHAPGLECAGVVSGVGPGVTGFAVGDRVAGLAPGALASEVTAPAHALVRVPGSLTDAEAATMPVAFATVAHGLGALARLEPGETVLVHGGAGGVGLAALQYARACGATVVATAGSPAKRRLLRALGVEHVFDSRGLEFADGVRRITGGRGVDVVLNSLAGPALVRSLELLRPGGRFVELGRRDMYEDNALPLRPFLADLSFFAFDLSAAAADPALAARVLAGARDAVAGRAFRPLPHAVHPAGRVAEAFRQLQHSHHVGKVVVAFDPDAEPVVVQGPPAPPALDPGGTYLVTGGLGGFGAATARWLADRGARHLALVGRRGADSPEAPALLAELAARGVRARAHAADVADPAALRRVLAALDPPLRGVVHAAMHLDDAPLAELDDERFRAVLAPKLGGAVVLDELTRDLDLDLFLLHSSVSALVGNPRQAPYAAANLFLEALVRQRRARGLPGTAVAWGVLGEAGYVARNGLAPAMAAAGLAAIGTGEALAALDEVVGAAEPVVRVGRTDWARLGALLPAVRGPRFGAPARSAGDTREELVDRLAALRPQQAVAALAGQLARLLGEVLRMDPAEVDPHRGLADYGVDSLLAAELLVAVRRRFGVEVPPLAMTRHDGTLADLAALVHERLGLPRPAGTSP
ncbi:type I polyketide synthase [Saccharothrix algeriensis]|uniref:Acyl transferase domain-containing protein/NADPH:quinone reductase-like Zn-dependent oxidoreductase/acyl carrier protein n=3 Tax=Saccharothrix algeriensis TaxID=173560 RepID=A0ABS2SFK6_9PSEU|nr:type I polyketide synthase [Saccharothrix algeriensis]MBM7815047.1 acyl transferase domain-containing protein/NADPH:quinone reductase-like Zn-dependent oxidoreductase/acyl carrier protein [Saccharothrix algeriensis]